MRNRLPALCLPVVFLTSCLATSPDRLPPTRDMGYARELFLARFPVGSRVPEVRHALESEGFHCHLRSVNHLSLPQATCVRAEGPVRDSCPGILLHPCADTWKVFLEADGDTLRDVRLQFVDVFDTGAGLRTAR